MTAMFPIFEILFGSIVKTIRFYFTMLLHPPLINEARSMWGWRNDHMAVDELLFDDAA